MSKADPFVVWDLADEPAAHVEQLLYWRRFDQGENISSIPRYVEEHADRLKKAYLAFIHDLAEHRVAGKGVVDHLDVGDGFSLWWMTLLAEKSPFKSPRIYDCLRLLALEEILLSKRPAAMMLASADPALIEAIARLSRNMGIRFRAERPSVARVENPPLRSVYNALPSWLQGLLSLRHSLRHWALRRVGAPRGYPAANDVFICSYFIHLDREQCARGEFYSRHWEGLPKLLRDGGRNVNWIQLFLVSEVVPDVGTAVRWVKAFNRDAANQGLHTFLESYLTPMRILRALRVWFWLIWVKWRLRSIPSAFNVHGSSAWLWPLLRHDWHSSLDGPAAMANCLNLTLFDAALAMMPRQLQGLYLYENQSWEKALLRAWRRHGHGEIIGVQHATVPFWHLYYFDDPRSLVADARCPLPLPDGIAVNGVSAWKAFAGGGYPVEKLIEVEALRYLYLHQSAGGQVRRARESAGWRNSGPLRVLVVGDMIPASMDNLMGLLRDAVKLIPARYAFTLKPHPGYAVDVGAFRDLDISKTNESLANLFGDYDAVLAANSTSAAVDAYVARLPVIVAIDGEKLNLSPLRGRNGAKFVSTPRELADALESLEGCETTDGSGHEEFFFLAPDLPRWTKLLAKWDRG